MALNDVEIGCDGASGTAGAFIVRVEANGRSVHQTAVTGQAVPERGGETWAWSLSWHVEGEATVTLADWTHIDWDSNEGTVRNVHDVYHLSCPVTTTTVAETPTVTPSTVPDFPFTPETTTTSVSDVSTIDTPVDTSPVATVALEPSTSIPETTVTYSAPLKRETTTTLTYSGHDEFYSAPTTVWGPCFEDGSCLPGYETTTTLGEPTGCCQDYTGDTTATTVAVPHGTLAATGGAAGPLVGVGVGVLAVGVLAVLVARRRRVV